MFDYYRAHVYRTEDFGMTWKRITEGLPDEGWVWIVREDPNNTDLLYAGTEVGLFALWDRGASWQPVSRDACHQRRFTTSSSTRARTT